MGFEQESRQSQSPKGATQSCSAWVQDSYSLTCDAITKALGMTMQEFQSWNPSTKLGGGCTLIRNLYYCVEVNYVKTGPSSTLPPAVTTTSKPPATSTTGGGGVATPSPTQAGMPADCNNFYQVAGGDTCGNIASTHGVSLEQFYAWNPAVGSTCASLWAGYWVCIGTGSSPPPTTLVTSTTTATTTTAAGNGITTPTPTQAGMVGNCNSFHLVVGGDSCYDIAKNSGITLDEFYSWNPAVSNTCASLWGGYYVCTGVIGGGGGTPTTTQPPTATNPGNGIVTPTPFQAGMTNNCRAFHSVVEGDTCFDIAAAAGIPLGDFYRWNPAVGTGCASLWGGYNVCVAVL
ncbi:hypothetical protein PG999_014501 [Apiospora kogelbergensis]|uniref:LysM domain-containing protein n=1 Tax=Apiospora kogelbergensis TaxID=1337665 RepID=A0AAW0Q3H0_9PEZI